MSTIIAPSAPSKAFSLFQNELSNLVHNKSQLEHSYKVNMLGRIVPNYFPHIFWKAPFVYRYDLWPLAERIMSTLLIEFLENPSVLLNQEKIGSLNFFQALLNYMIWKGQTQNILKVANLFLQYEIQNEQIFEIVALEMACQKNFPQANKYRNKIEKPSSYFLLAFHNLQQGIHKKYKDKSSQNQSLFYNFVYALQNNERAYLSQLIQTLSYLEYENYDTLLFSYSTLLNYGLLYRANRLLLRTIRTEALQNIEKSFLVNIVLQSYLWNQKFYAYLRRLIQSSSWPGARTWYEQEFCIASLNLEDDKRSLWDKIKENKKEKIIRPHVKRQNEFNHFLKEARLDTPHLPKKLEEEYALLILARYMNAPVSFENAVRRRYTIFNYFILNPIKQNRDLDSQKIFKLSPYLYWTLFIYIGSSPSLLKLQNLIEALCSSNLLLRALLGMYYFKSGAKHWSEILFRNLTYPHPLLQNNHIEVLLAKNKFLNAHRIARRIKKIYPRTKLVEKVEFSKKRK